MHKNFFNFNWFLANMSEHDVARPSVCRLSLTLVHPTQPVEIFDNVSMPSGTMAILWHPRKILLRSSQGNSSVGQGD